MFNYGRSTVRYYGHYCSYRVIRNVRWSSDILLLAIFYTHASFVDVVDVMLLCLYYIHLVNLFEMFAIIAEL